MSFKPLITALILALALAPALAAAPQRLLPEPPHPAPASNPQLPDEMAPFNPPTSPAIAATAPAIAAFSPAAVPDGSVTLTGDFLHTQFLLFGQTTPQNGLLNFAQIQALSAHGVVVTVPDTQAADSMYLVWPQTSDGVSSPVAINHTTATWLLPPMAAAGETISVFGRNLTSTAAHARAWVYLQSAAGQGEWIPVTSANPYKIDFVLPANLPLETYQVWVHNGLGGKYGWASPLTLSVKPLISFNRPTIDIKDFGAAGDGKTDDGPAIIKALAAAGPYGTLHFGVGTYRVANDQILLPRHIRLLGDDPRKTILRFTGDVDRISQKTRAGNFAIGAYDNNADRVEINSLTLDYAGPSVSGALVRLRHGTDLTFSNVALLGHALCPLDWQGSSGLVMQNCVCLGTALSLIQTHDVRIDQTAFREAYESDSAIDIWDGHDISITRCTFQDDNPTTHDNSGWGCGRIIVNNLNWATNYNQYFAQNTSIALGGRVPYNDGEQISGEGTIEAFTGSPLAATSDTLTLPPTFKPIAGYSVIVTYGPAVGQLRTAESFTVTSAGITLKLDRPWAINPGTDSRVDVCTTWRDCVCYQNNLQCRDDAWGPAHLQAATGFEPWSGGYNLVFDGNTTTRMNHGVLLSSFGLENPCYFIDIVHNHLIHSRQTGVDLWPNVGSKAWNFIGVMVRDNTIDTAGRIGVDLYLPTGGAGAASLSAIEHNTITNVPIGLSVYTDRDVLAYRNSFDAGAAAGPGSVAVLYGNSLAAILLRDNTYAHFNRDFVTDRRPRR